MRRSRTYKRRPIRGYARAALACGVLGAALFSGAAFFLPIGHEALNDGTGHSFLVLNPPAYDQVEMECLGGVLRMAIPASAGVYPSQDNSEPQISSVSQGNMACVLGQEPSGWWKVSLPGGNEGWAPPATFRSVKLALESQEAITQQIDLIQAQARARENELLAQKSQLAVQAAALEQAKQQEITRGAARLSAKDQELLAAKVALADVQAQLDALRLDLDAATAERTRLTMLAIGLTLLFAGTLTWALLTRQPKYVTHMWTPPAPEPAPPAQTAP